MASYPGSLFDPRKKENAQGVVYDAEKKANIFVEDISFIEEEIIAVETELLAQKEPQTIPTSHYPGVQGTICFNKDCLFICISENDWRRVKLESF